MTVVLLALVGVFLLTKEKSPPSTNNTNATVSNHIAGAGNKKVTLVEYGDYECPACKAYYPIVKQLQQAYGDDITFQFRNFPLVQIHQNAMLGSRAAEAAGIQNKYWEMHDLLYENQDEWSKASNPTAVLETYAQQLGLNVGQFKTDMASATTNDIINADRKAGNDLGANSTPTFILQGKKIDKNPQTIEEFKALIDDAIKAANPGQ